MSPVANALYAPLIVLRFADSSAFWTDLVSTFFMMMVFCFETLKYSEVKV
jgi:hypothetical protein